MKLYLVKLKGMSKVGSEPNYQESYVVDDSAESAYQQVKEYLEKEYTPRSTDIELDYVKLIAETGEYPACQTVLFISNKIGGLK